MGTPRTTFLHDLGTAMREHQFRAELICYSLLLVGGVQIILREYYPHLQPPWPIVGMILIILCFGVIIVPPVWQVIRRRRGGQGRAC